MAFHARFFGTICLVVCGAISGICQDPPVPPAAPAPKAAKPADSPAATAPPATTATHPTASPASPPATAANPPAAAAAPASGTNSAGVTMVQDLLAALAKYDLDGRPAKQNLGFEIPEKALNDYLAYTLRARPRPGISAMKLALSPGNQVSSEVEMDFDAIQKWSPGIFPEVLAPLLTGKRTIKADIQFESGNGTCSFTLKSSMGPDGKALVNKVMLAVLQSLGSRQPEAVDPAKPISLPFGLKRIWTEKQMICGEN